MNAALPFPGFSSPAVGTEAPLDLLAACHTRVEKQCSTVERLRDHLYTHGSDAAAQEAAQAVLRYFNTAARHHHEDEEQDLFPALMESMAGSDAVCIRELCTRLMDQHRQLEARWAVLRGALVSVANGVPVRLDDADPEGFVQAYREHIALEDQELLPMAQRLLSEDTLKTMGQNMRQRRQP